MYYYHNNDSQTGANNNNIDYDYNNTDSPLFSQPLDPSALEELPTEFLNCHQFDPNSLLNEPLFDMNNSTDWDYYQQQQVMDPQEAILLSDPNFLRQHQLLQDQQKEMHTRLKQDEGHEVNTRHGQSSHLAPTLETNDKTDNTQALEESNKNKQQKRTNNRRQQVVGKSTTELQEDDTKIDHQRRFNELQARFRVNYARKPSQQQPPLTKTPKKLASSVSPVTQPQQKQESPSPVSVYNDDQTLVAPLNNTHVKPVEQRLSSLPSTPTAARTSTAIKTPSVAIGGLAMNTNNTSEDQNNTNTTPPPPSLSFSFPSRTMPIQIQRVARQSSSQPFDAESHQRQLDSQLDKVDFDDITVSELKEMLRQRGKPATGKKAVLLQRLQEERDTAKGGRSPGTVRNHRHSQPLPFSRSFNNNYIDSPQQQQRPRSFQGASSPVMIQHNKQRDNSFASSASPSSVPSYLPPGSPGGQLHRSIANMHIGSPPANASRRYSPYSPRLSSSPKPIHHEYSTSAPSGNNDLASSPGQYSNQPIQLGHSNNMMLSSSYSVASRSATTPTGRYYNNPKTYKPFMSSALATPDREEDINPFDSYYAGSEDPPIKEEDVSYSQLNGTNNNNMDWTDPAALDLLLQQGTHNMNTAAMIGQPLYSDDVVLSNEQIMALLNSQQQASAFEFKLDDSTIHHHYHPQPH